MKEIYRVGRACIYEDPSQQTSSDVSWADTQPQPQPRPQTHLLHRSQPDKGIISTFASLAPGSVFGGRSPGFLFSSSISEIDPFQHQALRGPTVDVAVCKEAARILGAFEDFQVLAARFFDTTHKCFPFISRARFNRSLTNLYSNPKADFVLLCLCIHLIIQKPLHDGTSMLSSEYVVIKSIISLLETINVLSLDFLEARLLVVAFEFGHGFYPAASISIAGCARTARTIGLNKKVFQFIPEDLNLRSRAEEEKRVWWTTVNLDR